MQLGAGTLTRILKRCKIERDTGCWSWTRSKSSDGYGRVRAGAGPLAQAHRVAWEAIYGPIVGRWVVDHLCRNRACCNPAHMELVTNRENALRGDGVGAINELKTHCPSGHKFTPENTITETRPQYKRRCRECRCQYERNLRARRTQESFNGQA